MLIVGALIVGALSTSCTEQSTEESPGPTQSSARYDTDGPLSSNTIIGGSSVEQPIVPADRIKATFGAFVLCSKDRGAEIVLDSVTFPAGSTPGARPWIRTITRSDIADTPRDDRAALTPLGFALGAPPSFDQPYADPVAVSGTFTPGLAGAVVDGSCDDLDLLGRDELLIESPSGPDGAQVDGFVIDYTAEGRPFSLPVRWDMVICDRARKRC